MEFDYNSARWKRKREKILRRDGYMCRNCRKFGRSREATEVHHIQPADEYPELGSEVEVIGVFETYVEDEDPDYVYTRLKDASMTVVKGPEVSSKN